MKLYWIILAILIASALFYYYTSIQWYEHFEPIEKIELPSSLKKQSNVLILHYGPVTLDVNKYADEIKAYAKEHRYDYFNNAIDETNIWSTIYSVFHTHQYEYIFAVPTRARIHDSKRSLRVLLQEAGDSCMILARSELDDKQVNLDAILFRDSEWTKYKLHQLYHSAEQPPNLEVVLDQIYTPYVHKTFTEFKEYLDMSVPYMLTNICVFHEHALLSSQSGFLRYHDRENTKIKNSVLVYPWSTIRHPRFVNVKSADVQLIQNVIPEGSRIPKIIFQTMETHLTMVNIRSCVEQTQNLNSEYKYYYFTAYDCRIFIQKHYPDVLEAYDTLLPGAYKADLWRYCVLHKYGGFYMDSRMYPYMSFDSIITKDTEFMSCIDCTPNMLYQAILGSVPNSRIMRIAIDECLENIKKRRNRIGDLAITGPGVMGKAVNLFLERTPTKNLDEITDKRIVFLRWNSIKVPKYLMSQEEIFACHKYTKLLTDKEVNDETTLWLILTGKEHYSSSYRNNRIYKDELFKF